MLRIANVLVTVVVLVMNGLAGAGALSGESIGVIANRYRSSFLPADYVFSIWGLIYLGLVGFTVYQALPAQRGNEAVRRIGKRWIGNGLLNAAWVVAFSYSMFSLAMVLMVALLVTLVKIHEGVGIGRRRLERADRFLIAWPFSLYLAWISVALIANTFQYATFLEWDGLGVSGATWSAIMMAAATLLGALMVFRRGSWIFPLVVIWALWGIRARYPEVEIVATSAEVLVAAGAVLAICGLGWRWWRRLPAWIA